MESSVETRTAADPSRVQALAEKVNQGFSEVFVTPATGFSGLSFVGMEGVALDGAGRHTSGSRMSESTWYGPLKSSPKSPCSSP